MSIDRNRSMMPPFMSWLTVDRGGGRAERGAQQDHAGHDVGRVFGAGVDRAAEQVDEQQHQHHRQHQRRDHRLDVAAGQPQTAADHGDMSRIGADGRADGRRRRRGAARVRVSDMRRSPSVAERRRCGIGGAWRGRSGRGRRRRASRVWIANRLIAVRSRIELVEQRADVRRRSRRWRRRAPAGARVALDRPVAEIGRAAAAYAVSSVAVVMSSRCSATCALSSRGRAVGDDPAAGRAPRSGRRADRPPPGTAWSGTRSRRMSARSAIDLPHHLAAGQVEAGGRLVEEDHRRLPDQAGREIEPAPHAAGVGADAPRRRRRSGRTVPSSVGRPAPSRPGRTARAAGPSCAGSRRRSARRRRRRTGRSG